jgi:ABC-type molybdate transport system permease subunit
MSDVNILVILATYVIGTAISYGLYFELYDNGLLGNMKLRWLEFLIVVWPVTMIGFVVLIIFNALQLIGRGAGETISRVWRWLRDE